VRAPSLVAAALLLAACGGASPRAATTGPEPEDGPAPEYVVALRLVDAGADERGTPRTRVLLVTIAPDGARAVAALRVEPGACWSEPLAGALTSARCWWGGAAALYRVRREGGAVVAERAEGADDSTTAHFVEIGRGEVPAGAPVRVLGATAGGSAAGSPPPRGGGRAAPHPGAAASPRPTSRRGPPRRSVTPAAKPAR